MVDLAAAMPNMVRHEGVWEGEYRHMDRDGTLVDFNRMTTRCEFPVAGPYAIRGVARHLFVVGAEK